MNLRPLIFLVVAAWIGTACGASQKQNAQDTSGERTQDPELLACDQTDEDAYFGDITRGALVRLHSPLEDEVPVNWSPDMDYYRGQVTRVTEPLGVDSAGCPGVRVEADDGVFFWRIRDVERVETQSDDDRCGQSTLTPEYRGMQKGDRVVIQEHRPWYGQENWTSAMDAWIGETATIQELEGLDEDGCPGVLLDVDEGAYFWRVRDLKPAK